MVSDSAINFQFRKYGDYGPETPSVNNLLVTPPATLVLAQDLLHTIPKWTLCLPPSASPQLWTHNTAGEADAPQAGAHVVPHTNAATADPLAHSQLQKEKGDANNDQQHQVWHQVGTCKEKRRYRSEGQ